MWKKVNMVSKACACFLICLVCFLLIVATMPKASALKRASNVDEYTVENRRTDLRRDYVLQGFDDELADDFGPKYEEMPPAGAGPGTLPFIVDYANMIRNDIILLDNSVETRTRKRGNIKVKKHTNQAIAHVPCNCERSNVLDEGLNYVNLTAAWDTRLVYPQLIRNLTCDETKCARPYRCQKIIYYVTVLKGTRNVTEMLSAGSLYTDMPNELKHKWVPRIVPVVAGCLCTTRYVAN